MAVDTTWPITAATLRKALGYKTDEGDAAELELFAAAACEAIDERTGRDTDPTRHLIGDPPHVPVIFIMAARETAKLWWQQTKNGPRGGGVDPNGQTQGPPMGAALPRKVEGWLEPYPAPPGFGQPIEETA